ncbi:SHOCT domain-containing protein [Actinomycetospora sp. CA-053990]|uniref:SHOCT domain-containing protein n=1 Tax=Actinomycetospora sp. CA-053990 TaxID=3239891 RepID=UPI003D8EB52C
MMWDGGGWAVGWMVPLMSVSFVLWWVLVIAVVLAVLRWWRMSEAGAGPQQDARQILDLRFARGEIDADEYATRRRAMTER